MDKVEVKAIADFLNDVYEGLCEGDGDAAMRLYLTELYRVIKRPSVIGRRPAFGCRCRNFLTL